MKHWRRHGDAPDRQMRLNAVQHGRQDDAWFILVTV